MRHAKAESEAALRALDALDGTKLADTLDDVLQEMLGGVFFANGRSLLDSASSNLRFTELMSNKGLLSTALAARCGSQSGDLAPLAPSELFPAHVIKQAKEVRKQMFIVKRDAAFTRGREKWSESIASHQAITVLRQLTASGVDIGRQHQVAAALPDSAAIAKWLGGTDPGDRQLATIRRALGDQLRAGVTTDSLAEATNLEALELTVDEANAWRDARSNREAGITWEGHDARWWAHRVKHGSHAFVRVKRSMASQVFEELGIPYVGGGSGTTAEFVAMLEARDDLTHTEREQLTVVFMMHMIAAGHHSLLEMLTAAQLWGYFLDVPNPLTVIGQAATIREGRETGGQQGEDPQLAPDILQIPSYSASLRAFERYVRSAEGLDLDIGTVLGRALEADATVPWDTAEGHVSH